jgi:hypothetical protein
MGAWGITERESDSGLDMLALIETKILKPIGFKYFDVKGIMEFCKNHIVEGIRRENEPYLEEGEDVQEYIDANFPNRYDTVIRLVAECLSEFFQKGVFVIEDYEAKIEMKITEFIFTDSVLDELLEELQKMLDPEHDAYTTWFEEDTRQEWVAHMKMMCDSMTGLKAFNKLDELRLKYERAERIRLSFQKQIENCLNDIDWHGNQEMIMKIITHLPSGYLRFRMYENYYELDEESNIPNDETSPSHKEGRCDDE